MIDLERSDLIGEVEGMRGGRTEWKELSSFLDTSGTIGNLKKEIIPFFALQRIIPEYENQWRTYRWFTSFRAGYSDTGSLDITELYKSSKIDKYPFFKRAFDVSYTANIISDTPDFSHSGIVRMNSKEDLIAKIKEKDISSCIMATLDSTKMELKSAAMGISKDSTYPYSEYGCPEEDGDNMYWRWSGYRKYKQALGHFLRGRGWDTLGTKTYINHRQLRYMVGSYFLMDVTNNDNPTHLVALVTKPQYLEYIAHSLAMSKKIDPAVFQVWVHPDFDVPRSIWKGIRPYIRKEFLIPMYDAGVPIIEKDNFNELFLQYTPPSISDIKGHKEWLVKCSREVMENYRVNNIKN